jgi:hypothetical protein
MNTKAEERFLRALDVLDGKPVADWPQPEYIMLADVPPPSAPHEPVTRKFVPVSRDVVPCWVYFIRCGDSVKIGVTAAVDIRLRQLQSASPTVLSVLASIRCVNADGAYELEGQLHKQFAEHRLRGEWFAWCDPIASYVATLSHKEAAS